MIKKLAIITISIFLLSFSANAGSDGELSLKKQNQKKLKIVLKN